MLRIVPLPDQLSSQNLVEVPSPKRQPVPRAQIGLALRRLSHVTEVFLDAEWWGGYLLRRVEAHISQELFRRAQALLARGAIFLA